MGSDGWLWIGIDSFVMRCLAGSSGALRFLCERKGGQGAARGSVWFQWLQSCRAAVKVESLAQQTAEDVPDAGFDNGEAEKWGPTACHEVKLPT